MIKLQEQLVIKNGPIDVLKLFKFKLQTCAVPLLFLKVMSTLKSLTSSSILMTSLVSLLFSFGTKTGSIVKLSKPATPCRRFWKKSFFY